MIICLKKVNITMGMKKKNSDSPRITLAQERIETEGCHEGVGHMECPNIINEGGCLTCRECGWSKCD